LHHDLALFANITIALLTAFGGGYLARVLGLPSLVGYLLAGMVIGPFTPGFVGDIVDIRQLAEMGVIFMMFGVGLHFSLKDLWAVRGIALPGAIMQMLLATAFGYVLARFWGWSVSASLVLGLAVSIASTIVLLRGLVDNGLLNTLHGQVAVGWLVLEDLATIGILVLMPILVGDTTGNIWQSASLALLNTMLFVGLMLYVGARLLPWLLRRIAHTGSRELFILSVVAIALGTAFGATELFGVSLALGAFLAGVVISESDIGHQVGEEVIPFREIFTVLFFVSVGMLVNPAFLFANAAQVLAFTLLIVVGKSIFTFLLGLILPASGRTMLVVAAGLSQIGEFSFIIGQAGLALGVLTQGQYSLILAGALISIVVNPLLFKSIPTIERWLQQLPLLWRHLDRHQPAPAPLHAGMTDHVVIVGYGRVGEHIVRILDHLGVSRLVIEQDARQASTFARDGVPTLLGDAANSEVMTHAGLKDARALVVTVPDESAGAMIVARAQVIAPNLPIIARAATHPGVHQLGDLGARVVIHPELEGGLEVMRHTLQILGYPTSQVQEYTDAVRNDQYNTAISSPEERRVLARLIESVGGMEIFWRTIGPDSELVGRTLSDANIRARTGASIIALVRNQRVMANPKSTTTFVEGDLVGLIGDAEQVAMAERIINPEPIPPGQLVPAVDPSRMPT
jgi:monovalent cation:H+ antiporter-2, CPA2 family